MMILLIAELYRPIESQDDDVPAPRGGESKQVTVRRPNQNLPFVAETRTVARTTKPRSRGHDITAEVSTLRGNSAVTSVAVFTDENGAHVPSDHLDPAARFRELRETIDRHFDDDSS